MSISGSRGIARAFCMVIYSGGGTSSAPSGNSWIATSSHRLGRTTMRSTRQLSPISLAAVGAKLEWPTNTATGLFLARAWITASTSSRRSHFSVQPTQRALYLIPARPTSSVGQYGHPYISSSILSIVSIRLQDYDFTFSTAGELRLMKRTRHRLHLQVFDVLLSHILRCYSVNFQRKTAAQGAGHVSFNRIPDVLLLFGLGAYKDVILRKAHYLL